MTDIYIPLDKKSFYIKTIIKSIVIERKDDKEPLEAFYEKYFKIAKKTI